MSIQTVKVTVTESSYVIPVRCARRGVLAQAQILPEAEMSVDRGGAAALVAALLTLLAASAMLTSYPLT